MDKRYFGRLLTFSAFVIFTSPSGSAHAGWLDEAVNNTITAVVKAGSDTINEGGRVISKLPSMTGPSSHGAPSLSPKTKMKEGEGSGADGLIDAIKSGPNVAPTPAAGDTIHTPTPSYVPNGPHPTESNPGTDLPTHEELETMSPAETWGD